MSLRSRILGIAVSVALFVPLLRDFHRRQDLELGRRFQLPPPAPSVSETPFFEAEVLPTVAETPVVHAPTILETDQGRLLAQWWGGSHEGARDVRILLSERPAGGGAWGGPRVLMSRHQAAEELRRPIRRLGNGVLWSAGGGELRFVFVSTTLGGWSTSSLNWTASHDGGATWSRARVLQCSPLLNLSELVRNAPVPCADGSVILPVYHELAGKFPELLWLRETGQGLSATRSRVAGGRTAFQPALAALSSTSALALCRNAGGSGQIWESRTEDSGRTWSALAPVGIPNPNAAIALLRLSDGRLLLAYNDSVHDRANLKLALGDAGGRAWRERVTLESEAGAEFSYPYLAAGRDGRIHLVYTWKRSAIRHVVFNLAWLQQERPEVKP